MGAKVLAGKAVEVTGAGRGIGPACAKGLGRHGARVVVNVLGPLYCTGHAVNPMTAQGR